MPLIQFPEGFLWGAGSSAWQIEGAISEGGRGRSIWDVYAGRRGRITGGQTADVACDHYNRVTADIELMRDLGLQAYRFSIAWPRIYPTGREKAANEVGLAHYERLVDGLLEAGIEPWITLYHWDLPQGLEDAGGWPARGTVSAFLRYVDTVARRLGDRVHRWITVHDPWAVSMLGYQRGEHAPGRTSWPSALGAAHHLLLAHGKAVQCIRSRAADSAVGISLGLIPTYAGSDREEDQAAAVAFDGQVNRWFLDPLFGRDYPADVVSAFAGRGFLRGPHLSEIRPGDLQTISTPFDFLGVNYRSRAVVLADEGRGNAPKVARVARGDQTTDGGLEVAPTALTHLLKRIGREYSGLPLYITEVGAAFHDAPSDEGRIEDAQRLAYLYDHLRACWNAAQGGAPLRGVFVRSLFDQFEWNEGYSQQYGIVHVDRSTQERTLKDSALWLRLVMRGNALQSRRK